MPSQPPVLDRHLTLFDVYAISTGAMFSSGFFLLPGIAFAIAGPSIIFAYLVSGLMILPAMLSQAELAAAMPRAGGAYFFLDRSFGPMIGTVGGLGTWTAMVLKTAFALIGLGAYLGLVIGIDIKPLALILTGLFLALNILGAREASWFQRVLVVLLLVGLALFVAFGVSEIATGGAAREFSAKGAFLKSGLAGFLSTVGLVSVSYAGLINVASVAEEVRDPDRSIPLGMGLSLLTAMAVYAVGAYVLVAVLEPDALGRPDLTPVASAAEVIFAGLPYGVGLTLVLVAAVGAFASTGNAAAMSASRDLFALARDRRVPSVLTFVGRFRTPTWAIVATCGAIAVVLLALEVEVVAKLASAFQLMLFAMVNVAVIVMRESRLESYDPGFRAPLYPWLQLAGVLFSLLLIIEMGLMAVLFTAGLVAASLLWYRVYARSRLDNRDRVGLYHAAARLLERHRAAVDRLVTRIRGLESDTLDMELRAIIQERGLRDQDPYDEVVARAHALDVEPATPYREALLLAAQVVAASMPVTPESVAEALAASHPLDLGVAGRGAVLPHLQVPEAERPELVLVRCREGLRLDPTHEGRIPIVCHAIVVLVSPAPGLGQHLRLLAHLALCLDQDDFLEGWLAAEGHQALRETLLRHERFLSLRLAPGKPGAAWIGKRVQELDLPQETLLAAIRRSGDVLFPRGYHDLREGDRVTVVGMPEALQELRASLDIEEETRHCNRGPEPPQPADVSGGSKGDA
jgi:amino acid transporter/mannitol/fructose-specific phosphotransferase system IIA component (Ntr-type)